MKQTLFFVLFFLSAVVSNVQGQTNTLNGKIFDSDRNILPGASIIIIGTKYGVNSNEAGEYLFDKIPAGNINVQVSFVGYKTLTTDFEVKPGQNLLDLTLENNDIYLEGITVTSQKREQQIVDVPITMSVVDAGFIEDNNIDELDKLAVFVPGFRSECRGLIVRVL